MNELVALYASPAALRMYDEAVTELDHALQAAALAQSDGAPDHLVAAALLHDVGHLVSDDNVTLDDDLTDDFHHERVGAQYLARWFGPEVTAPVALHVAAKRYLCAIEPGYLDGLSPSSARSLALQGGPDDGRRGGAVRAARPSRGGHAAFDAGTTRPSSPASTSASSPTTSCSSTRCPVPPPDRICHNNHVCVAVRVTRPTRNRTQTWLEGAVRVVRVR